jgi:FtsH-binding integral membrane protein
VSEASPDPEGSPEARSPGWREVLLVALVVVAAVLGAAALTGFLPTELQRLVFHSPLAIGFLIVGTVLVLWRVAVGRRPPV